MRREPDGHLLARLPARWRHKIHRDRSGCWLWRGAVGTRGYGMVRHERRTQTIHRVVYRELVGEIPDGYEIDHTCTEKLCANPRHLEAVAPDEHHRRTRERANDRCRRREERRRMARLGDVCTSVYPNTARVAAQASERQDFPLVEVGCQMRLFAG